MEENTATEMTTEQVDSLVNDIERTRDLERNTERPMSEETKPVETQSNVPQVLEREINWKGKPVKIPGEKFDDYLSKGYDYEQRMAEFNQKQRQLETQIKSQYETQYKPYSELYQIAEKNPEWWKYVNEQYKAALSGQQTTQPSTPVDTNDPYMKEILAMKQELEQFRTVKQELEEQKLQAQRARADEEYQQSFNAVAAKYPKFNFTAIEPDGTTLEYKVLEFADQHKLTNFEHAFTLYKHDELVKLAAEQAKEQLIKENQKRTKLGLSVSDQGNKVSNRPVQQTTTRGYPSSASILAEMGFK